MGERRIKITTDNVEVTVALNDSPTSELVWTSLPLDASGSTWGDEIYFRTPVQYKGNDSQEVVNKGDVAYWPPGQAICLFWGPTPASRNPDEIRPASPVNLIGKIQGDPTVLGKVRAGSNVRVERA